MNLEDKLNLILDYKNDIKNSLIKKGSDIDNSTPLSGYAEKIDNLPTSSDIEWTPDPEWWDIESILKEDTFNGSFDGTNPDGKTYKKIIILLDDTEDSIGFKLSNNVSSDYNGFPFVKLSDGTTFTATGYSGRITTHTWDKSKDKPSSVPDKKTRYAIFYLPIEDKDYVLTDPSTSGALSGTLPQALYIITELKLKYDNGGTSCPKLQAIKCIGEGSVEIRSNSSAYSAIWSKSLKFYYIENAHSDIGRYQMVSYSGGGYISVKMPPEAYSSIDETTGLKTYDLVCSNSSSFVGIKKLDISSITDFSEVSSNLFTTSKIIPSKIEGVIDLSQNVQNTSFTIFNSNLNNGINLGGRVISFELKLPNNADVTINSYKMDYATIKYLVENAPVLTETHTLTLYIGKNGLDVSKDYLINYNGQLYSDGKKVLELKGWTVNIS